MTDRAGPRSSLDRIARARAAAWGGDPAFHVDDVIETAYHEAAHMVVGAAARSAVASCCAR